jgi:hypothetical protein
MVQHGQTIELTRRGPDGERLSAYRYRTGGRDSRRVQRGGFVSEEDARDALERELEQLVMLRYEVTPVVNASNSANIPKGAGR